MSLEDELGALDLRYADMLRRAQLSPEGLSLDNTDDSEFEVRNDCQLQAWSRTKLDMMTSSDWQCWVICCHHQPCAAHEPLPQYPSRTKCQQQLHSRVDCTLEHLAQVDRVRCTCGHSLEDL